MSLAAHHEQHGATLVELGPARVPADFGDLRAEYAAATERVGLHDRSYRGLIEITGADRAAWLHNLTTNDIKTLKPGFGHYAFALNIKGRVLFDGNVLALPESLLLDIDRRWIGAAMEHLGKYIIMEDVRMVDQSGDFARMALLGPKVLEVLKSVCTVLSTGESAQAPDEIGTGSACGSLGGERQLQHCAVRIDDVECRIICHDFAGPGRELIVPADNAVQVWTYLLQAGESCGIAPLGLDAVQALRTEAGIPWSLEDIDNGVLPAETRQVERSVSFQKGCYLGQEVVERIRALGAPARLLVGLTFDGEVAPGATLTHEGKTVGRVTSAVNSFKLDRQIGLGYIKAAHADPGTSLLATGGEKETSCRTCEIPFH